MGVGTPLYIGYEDILVFAPYNLMVQILGYLQAQCTGGSNTQILTALESAYIELIFSKIKSCAKTNGSKDAQNRHKTAKIGTSCLAFRVTRALLIKL